MRLVILESPYLGSDSTQTFRHINYAKLCLSDSLHRGESPIASHMLFAAHEVLDDSDEHQREQGIAAGLAWLRGAEATVVYKDYGVSKGMKRGIREARKAGVPVEYRRLWGDPYLVLE